MLQKTWFKNTLFSVLSVIICLSCFYGVFNFYGMVIDELKPALKVLPVFFSGVMSVICYVLFIKEVFIKKVTKTEWIVNMAIIGVLFIYVFISLIYFGPYYFGNSTNLVKVIYMIFWEAFCLAAWIYVYLRISKKTLGNTEIDIFCPSYLVNFSKKGSRIGYVIYFLFASYFVGDFILAFFRFGNYWIEPFWYPWALIFILMPALNLVYVTFRKEGRTSDLLGLGLGVLNVFFVVSYFLLAKLNYYAIELTMQNLFFIDYSVSIPIGPVIIVIELLVSTGIIIYRTVKDRELIFKKKAKV